MLLKLATAVLLFCNLLYLTHAARTIIAAPKHRRLHRRDLSFEPRFTGNILFYVEENAHTSPTSAIKLTLDPKLPLLIHEDIEDHINTISCTNRSIQVNFESNDTMLQAYRQWQKEPEFLFSTSNSACALLGEHALFRVLLDTAMLEERAIRLSATRANLRNMTHRIDVELGSHLFLDVDTRTLPDKHVQSRALHNREKRAVLGTKAVDANSPTPSSQASSASANISFSYVNKTLIPLDADFADLVPVSSVENLALRCTNCTMLGSIDINAAGFTISNNIAEIMNKPSSLLSGGYFEFVARGIAGEFAFEFILKPGFGGTLFEAKLPDISPIPFSIPGLIEFRPVLELSFPIEIELDSDVTISTGFKFQVPNNSKIVLNITHLSSSTCTGFNNTTVDALPFNINAVNLSAILKTAFRPKLILDFNIGDQTHNPSNMFDFDAQGQFGMYLDLPQLITNFTHLTDVNATCDGPAPITKKKKKEPAATNTTSILVDYSASIGVGGISNFQAELGPSELISWEKEEEIANFTKSLGSTCLLFDEESKSLVEHGPEVPDDDEEESEDDGEEEEEEVEQNGTPDEGKKLASEDKQHQQEKEKEKLRESENTMVYRNSAAGAYRLGLSKFITTVVLVIVVAAIAGL